jgi:hypothetical protein
MTNNGLEIRTVLLKGNDLLTDGRVRRRMCYLPLNCARENEGLPLMIRLRHVDVGRYQRALYVSPKDWLKWPNKQELATLVPRFLGRNRQKWGIYSAFQVELQKINSNSWRHTKWSIHFNYHHNYHYTIANTPLISI